jgi:hypothetical protein
MASTSSESSASSRTLHLVFNSTDKVCGFLAAATSELSGSGNRQTIVAIDDPSSSTDIGKLREHAVLVLVKNGKANFKFWNFYRACCREIAAHPPSTLHLHGITSYVIGLLALRKSSAKSKIVYSALDSCSITTLPLSHGRRSSAARSLMLPVKAAANATVPPEPWGSTYLVGIPVDEAFLNCPRDEATSPTILSGGVDADRRTVDNLSQIAVLLSAEELKIGFEWLGEASAAMTECFQAASVRIVDVGDRLVHAHQLSKGWIYVVPRKTTGYPLSLIQALAAGLPSVVLDCPQHRYVIEHGRTGFLCASEEEMVRTIAQLIDDSVLRHRVGRNARASARARFESSAFRHKLLNCYAVSHV